MSNQTSNQIPTDYIPDEMLTVRQAAGLLGMSEKALRNRIDRNVGPDLIRLGRSIRILGHHLREWVERGGI